MTCHTWCAPLDLAVEAGAEGGGVVLQAHIQHRRLLLQDAPRAALRPVVQPHSLTERAQATGMDEGKWSEREWRQTC